MWADELTRPEGPNMSETNGMQALVGEIGLMFASNHEMDLMDLCYVEGEN